MSEPPEEGLLDYFLTKLNKTFGDTFAPLAPMGGAVVELGKHDLSLAKALYGDGVKAVKELLESGVWSDLSGVGTSVWDSIGKPLVELVSKEFKPQSIAPENVWGRAMTAITGQSVAGLVAHGVSTVLSANVFGFGALNATGLAAMIGKVAGFDDTIGAMWGAFNRAWLTTPATHWFNSLYTPELPGVGELLSLRASRRLPGGPDAATMSPEARLQWAGPGSEGWDSLKKLLAYHGLSEKWAEPLDRSAFQAPRMRDLYFAGELDTADDTLLWKVLRRSGYAEEYLPLLVATVKRRTARTWINSFIAQVIDDYVDGVSDDDRLDADVAGLGVSTDLQARIREVAARKRANKGVANETANNLTAFSKGQITEGELEASLNMAYADPFTVQSLMRKARLGMYKKVYWTSAPEAAQEVASVWRKLFVAGLATDAQYETNLIAAGYEPDAVSVMYEADDAQRKQQVAADFRRFVLPAMRDQVLNGQMQMSAYVDALKAGGFPPLYVPTEAALVGALLNRKRQQRVERYELPAYEAAYVVGLTGSASMRTILAEAGLSVSESKARMTALNARLNAYLGSRAAELAKNDARLKAAADAEAAALERQLAADRIRAEGLVGSWAKLKSEEAKAQVAPLIDEVAAVIAQGMSADGDRLAALVTDLRDALFWAKVAPA
jgi:hypothetical protein